MKIGSFISLCSFIIFSIMNVLFVYFYGAWWLFFIIGIIFLPFILQGAFEDSNEISIFNVGCMFMFTAVGMILWHFDMNFISVLYFILAGGSVIENFMDDINSWELGEYCKSFIPIMIGMALFVALRCYGIFPAIASNIGCFVLFVVGIFYCKG